MQGLGFEPWTPQKKRQKKGPDHEGCQFCPSKHQSSLDD